MYIHQIKVLIMCTITGKKSNLQKLTLAIINFFYNYAILTYKFFLLIHNLCVVYRSERRKNYNNRFSPCKYSCI